MTGRRSGVDVPFAAVAVLPYQDLQPHRAAIVDRAARFVDDVPAP